jgi:hypothetical protein
MDFFEQQERSRRQTRWLLAYFALAVAVIIALGYIVFASLTLPFLKPLPPVARESTASPLRSAGW